MPTFEQLRARIAELARPSDANSRQIYWVADAKIGVAIDPRGGFEVFLVSERLHPRLPSVARQLQFDMWLDADGNSFQANRLVFPPAPHFLGFSSLVATELLAAGWGIAGTNPQATFEAVEPLIDMALRRAGLSEEALLGLIGELLVLEQLLVVVASNHAELRSAVLDSWRGYLRESRDFVLDGRAIEVKTTVRPTAEHHIHGLSQVEALGDEKSLGLLSISLTPTTDGIDLPGTVDRVLVLLRDEVTPSPLQTRFLRDVRQYSVEAGLGYDHDVMQSWPVYRQSYLLTFSPRLYDMGDEMVRLIRSADIVGTFVKPEAIEYTIRLPARLSDSNPEPDWQQALASLVRSALRIGDQMIAPA